MARYGGLRILIAAITVLLLALYTRDQFILPKSSTLVIHRPTVHQPSPAEVFVPESINSTHNSDFRLPPRPLQPRAPTWEQAIEKGGSFTCLWQSGLAPQSEFSYADLDKWGWEHDPDNVNFNAGPVRAPFNALDLSIQSPPNLKESWGHYEDKTIDGTLYKATGGVYEQTFNVDQGVIIVAWVNSPFAVVEAYKEDNYHWPWPVPKLWRWSDVTFLLWKQQCDIYNKPVAGLTWVFRATIINAVSKALIFQALGDANSITAWPGKTFHVSTDAGKALVASPNVSGVAWMLAQNHAAFAGKVIDYITVYGPAARPGRSRPEAQIRPCLAIHIADGPAGLW